MSANKLFTQILNTMKDHLVNTDTPVDVTQLITKTEKQSKHFNSTITPENSLRLLDGFERANQKARNEWKQSREPIQNVQQQRIQRLKEMKNELQTGFRTNAFSVKEPAQTKVVETTGNEIIDKLRKMYKFDSQSQSHSRRFIVEE